MSLLFLFGLLVSGCIADAPNGGPEAVLSQLERLLAHPHTDTRRTAALSLGKIALPAAAGPLIGALHDEDPLVRQYSAWALGNLGELAPSHAAGALAGLLDDPSFPTAMAAAEAIGKINVPSHVVEHVLNTLHHPSEKTRRAAIQALIWLEHPSAYGALIESLKDAHAEVRQGAVAALGELGDRRAVPRMQDRLQHDPAAGVRSEAAYRIGKMGDAGSISMLKAAALGDPEPAVREWATWAARQLKPAGEPG